MSTTTTTWSIIDNNDGEVAGEAPGETSDQALEAFRRDALDGEGRIDYSPMLGTHLTHEGTIFIARQRTSVAGGDDQRYTDGAIATMSAAELANHLAERKAQRDRAKRDMTRCHGILERVEDCDGRAYTDAIANLGSYTREHATLNRIIRKLEREQENRRLANLGAIDADAHRMIPELVDNANAKRGLPCGIDEAGDTTMAAQMWLGATTALENETEDQPSNAKVAERVADAYAVIYGYDRVEPAIERATRDGATADADEIELRQLTAIDRSDNVDACKIRRQAAALARALAVTITDPSIRQHLDPKALEQARTALGLDD